MFEIKTERAHAAVPDLKAGNYWLPRTEWAKEFIEECAAFPNASNEDRADAWRQDASWFRSSVDGIFEYYEETAAVDPA